MKNTASVITACLTIAALSLAKAQTFSDFKKMPAEEKARFISDSLRANLRLSATQYDNVYNESLSTIKKMMPVLKEDAGRLEKRGQMRTFLTDEEAKLKTILTPEQYTLFQHKKQKAITYYMQHIQDRKILFNVPQ